MLEKKKRIRVVIVDDSIQFRTVLCALLKDHPLIKVIGEAVNGIEALDLILKSKPDVILMDFEMPLMDGMTALQHLMIHVPTPTIMFSRLTKEGTARCFDALKNGAVDFYCKNNLPTISSDSVLMQELSERVICASHVSVKAVEPIFPKLPRKVVNVPRIKTLIFCEECGAKTELIIRENEDQGGVICTNCGDHITLEQRNKYRRANFISLVIAGEGAYINLLKLVPHLRQDINGALLILIDGTVEHVDAFTEYLNSISTINIVRIKEGITIQGGNCYIGCENESILLRPYSADYTIRCKRSSNEKTMPLDRTMSSIAKVFKNRTAVLFLSGNEPQGKSGLRDVLKMHGSVLVLNPKRCLYKRMGLHIMDNFSPTILASEEELAMKISEMHLRHRDTIVTA